MDIILQLSDKISLKLDYNSSYFLNPDQVLDNWTFTTHKWY